MLTAPDLLCWTTLRCFADIAGLARCESPPCATGYVAAQLVHIACRTELRIECTWRWATAIAEGFHRLRVAFA